MPQAEEQQEDPLVDGHVAVEGKGGEEAMRQEKTEILGF